MELPRAQYLVSARGRQALAGLPPALESLNAVQLASALRKDFPADEASALAEQVTLRAKARERFGDGSGFLFTADGLEMMTHPLVAVRRAKRLAELGLTVVDLTCGLGGDLRACADAGMRASGIERDRATTLLAAANVPAAGVVCGEATRPPFKIAKAAVIVDPSRRSAAGRRFDPKAFSPTWDEAIRLVCGAQAGVLKAPPGIEARHLPAEAEVEFVQLGRSMREAAVWVGEGATEGLRRALLLPAGVELDSDAPEAPGETVALGDFIFDPESCVTLAGLVRQLAYRLRARLMDRQVAYLTASAAAFDPLCATFEVFDVLPFSVARLKTRLVAGGWAPNEIRRRAFPVEPDELRRLLGRIEGEAVTLLCTTLGGRRTIFVARRLAGAGEGIAQQGRQ